MKIKLIPTEKKVKEFSKRVVVAMTILWFAGALFGGYICWKQNYGLDTLLNYIGTPMGVGILGYLLKAAFENKEKIKKSPATSRLNEEVHP